MDQHERLDGLHEDAMKFLHDGEKLERMIPAYLHRPRERGRPERPLALVFTNTRILLCNIRARLFGPLSLGTVMREFPRSTKIGHSAASWIETTSFGHRLFISHHHVDDVIKADSWGRRQSPEEGARPKRV